MSATLRRPLDSDNRLLVIIGSTENPHDTRMTFADFERLIRMGLVAKDLAKYDGKTAFVTGAGGSAELSWNEFVRLLRVGLTKLKLYDNTNPYDDNSTIEDAEKRPNQPVVIEAETG